MKYDADVIVVGGGPAGSGAATWLARQGFAVTLLDRARFPRDKACGEFLTRAAQQLLDDLGVWDGLKSVSAQTVAATVLVAPDGSQTRHVPADGGPTGYAARRVVLDAALLEGARRAGVDVREGSAVRELLRDAGGQVQGVTGRDETGEPMTLRARLVIGADGSHSLVARQLNLVRALPRLQRVAVVSHWQNVSGAGDTIAMRARGPIVCGAGFPGPRSETGASANVTLVVPTSLAPHIAGRAGDFTDEILSAQFPDLAESLRGARRETAVRTIGCFGHRCRPAIADGALLVGDAATFIDPFTGEGVYFALRGAQLAAQTATTALRAGDTSRARLASYSHARCELAQRYLLCDLVQAVVRRPALLAQVVRRFALRPGVGDRLLGILSDTRPPADLLHPAFLWRLLAPELPASA